RYGARESGAHGRVAGAAGKGDRGRGGRGHRLDPAAQPPDRGGSHAGHLLRCAADPLRPGRLRGLGGQRLFLGQHAAEPRPHCDGLGGAGLARSGAGEFRARYHRSGGGCLHDALASDRDRGQNQSRMTYLDYQATTPLAPE
ncbi:hypothetical protein QU38_01255, partial [Staphylococcus aureus]